MKQGILLISVLLLFTCSSKNDQNSNCNFLLNVGVNLSLNLNLPQFNSLQITGNSVYIANVGNNGVIVANAGSAFFAWDATDPNHSVRACSTLSPSGLNASCGCEENTFSLVNGQPLGDGNLQCGLLSYRVTQSGNTLIVGN